MRMQALLEPRVLTKRQTWGQRHTRTHLQPRDQEGCQTQRAGMLATVVLGLGWDLGRGNTKNRENLTRVSLNPILPSAMS